MTARPNTHGADFDRGLDLFNRAHFFDAHEVLEDVWRSVPGGQPLRLHLQGVVQLAVAFHHESTGNNLGARSVLERALRNLKGAESSLPDVDLDRLRSDLAPWRRYLDDCLNMDDERAIRVVRPPVLPKIALRR
jgi:predicted metal-dependent hydrolase